MNIKLLRDYIYICRNLDRKPTFKGFRRFRRAMLSNARKTVSDIIIPLDTAMSKNDTTSSL